MQGDFVTRRHAAVLVCAFAVACGGESGPNGIAVGSIDVTPGTIALAQQASVQLQVAARDEEGVLLAGVPVTFTSENTDLVTVSALGLVRSAGPAGVTSIIVRAGGKTVSVPATVTATGNTIRILPSPATLPQKASLQLDVALLDLVGTPIPGAILTYATSDQNIATVNLTGLVGSVGPSGSVTVTVTSGALSAAVRVSVTQVPTSLEVTPDEITLGRNGSRTVAAALLDAVGDPIPGAPFSFTASPAGLLGVTSGGVVTAMGTPGNGTLTVTSGTFTTDVPVSIIDVGTLTGSILKTVPALGSPYAVALAPGGAIYGAGIGGRFYRGTFGSDALDTYVISSALTVGLAVNPSTGKVYVAGRAADALMEVDPATGVVLRRWETPGQMYDVAVSPDGQSVYVAGEGTAVHVISATTMAHVTSFTTTHDVVHLLAHPTEPLVYASGGATAMEIDVQTGAQRTFSQVSAQATALTIANDRLFIGSESGMVGAVDLTTGSTTTVDVFECGVYDIVAAPDGQQLLVTCALNGAVKLLDVETLAVLKTIPAAGIPRRAAISADGTAAVVANEAGWIHHLE
jgi:YVTN family beta-propeller protein